MNRYENFHFTVDTDSQKIVYKADYNKGSDTWDIDWNGRTMHIDYTNAQVQKWLKSKEWIVQDAPKILPAKFNFTYKGYPGYTHHAKLVNGVYKLKQARDSIEYIELPKVAIAEDIERWMKEGWYIIQDEDANKKRNQELRDADKKSSENKASPQAKLNGWPDWDKLPDNFVITPLSNNDCVMAKARNGKYSCWTIKEKMTIAEGLTKNPDGYFSVEAIKGHAGSWKYRGEYAEPKKSEQQLQKEEAIKHAKNSLEHHELMAEQYRKRIAQLENN